MATRKPFVLLLLFLAASIATTGLAASSAKRSNSRTMGARTKHHAAPQAALFAVQATYKEGAALCAQRGLQLPDQAWWRQPAELAQVCNLVKDAEGSSSGCWLAADSSSCAYMTQAAKPAQASPCGALRMVLCVAPRSSSSSSSSQSALHLAEATAEQGQTQQEADAPSADAQAAEAVYLENARLHDIYLEERYLDGADGEAQSDATMEQEEAGEDVPAQQQGNAALAAGTDSAASAALVKAAVSPSSSTAAAGAGGASLSDVITGKAGTQADELDLEDYMHVAALWDNLPASQLAAASALLRSLLKSLGVPAADGQPVPRRHQQRVAVALAAQLSARRLVAHGSMQAHTLRADATKQALPTTATTTATSTATAGVAATTLPRGTSAARRQAAEVGKASGAGNSAVLLSLTRNNAAGAVAAVQEGRELQEESSGGTEASTMVPEAGADVPSPPVVTPSPGDVTIGASPPPSGSFGGSSDSSSRPAWVPAVAVLASVALIGTVTVAIVMAVKNRRMARSGYYQQPSGLQMQQFGGDSAVTLPQPPAGYSDAPGHSRASFGLSAPPAAAAPGAPQPPAARTVHSGRMQF